MIRRKTSLTRSLSVALSVALLCLAAATARAQEPSAATQVEHAMDNAEEAAADTAAEAANQVPLENREGAGHGDGHGDGHGGGHGAAHHEDPTKTFNFTHLMYWGKDRYGGVLGDGVEGPNNQPEEPMPAPFILMLVNFGLLLVILAKFGGPPLRKMAESRSDQIKHALDEAGALRAKAAAKLAEYETRLSDADAQIAKMVEGMRADAQAEKERIAAAAAVAAAHLQRDAELRIAAEIERARHELRAEVTAAAMAAAEQVLKSKTTAADQTKLFEQFIGDMQQVGARAGATPTSKERS